MADYGGARGMVRLMADAMEKALRDHDRDRGPRGWLACDIGWLLSRLQEELFELRDAIDREQPPEILLREAADVANFAGMVADAAAWKWALQDEIRRRIVLDVDAVLAGPNAKISLGPEGRSIATRAATEIVNSWVSAVGRIANLERISDDQENP